MPRETVKAAVSLRRGALLAALALAGCIGEPPVWPDGGAIDSGRKDAGPPDAGEPDAGAPDAGAPDAGVPDAGRAVFAITAGGGAVKATGGGHSITLSVGQPAAGTGLGATHRVQLGVLRGTQAK